jgi:phosphate transport system substrate-binding protein
VKVHCGGKRVLKASGSTAQANAITRFVTAFENACRGQTLSYTANGSGAGVREFISDQTDFDAGGSGAGEPQRRIGRQDRRRRQGRGLGQRAETRHVVVL